MEWNELSVRREVENITMFYQIVNYQAPQGIHKIVHLHVNIS